MELKELTIEDMMYLDDIVAEVFGSHAMVYNPKDRYCHLASPVSFDDGDIIAIGIKEDDELSIKIRTADGEKIAGAIEV